MLVLLLVFHAQCVYPLHRNTFLFALSCFVSSGINLDFPFQRASFACEKEKSLFKVLSTSGEKSESLAPTFLTVFLKPVRNSKLTIGT